MPIGEPWTPGSSCDRLLWTLPVTAAEIGFRREHGHEELERRFDAAQIIPTDPFRASVV